MLLFRGERGEERDIVDYSESECKQVLAGYYKR